jgi:predicted enzyme related to lactoylglutathione lyase
MASHRGKFVWYELMTTDIGAAEKFYGDVIGWKVKDSGMTEMTYKLAEAGTAQVAGIMGVPPGAHPSWVGYVAVDDVDASAAEAKRLGGSIYHEASDIPGVGRFAVIGDPHGAGIALFKGTSEAPPEVPAGTTGHGGWRELSAGNLDQAFAFYSTLFGWTKSDAMDMGGMGVYQLFAIDGVQSGGMMNKPPQVPMPSWLYYFIVDAVDAAGARVRDGGGKILNGPTEVPGGSWILQCADPQGVAFALVAPKR